MRKHLHAILAGITLLLAATSSSAVLITVTPKPPTKQIMFRMPAGVYRGCLWVDGMGPWASYYPDWVMRRHGPADWILLPDTRAKVFTTLKFHFSKDCDYNRAAISVVQVPNDRLSNLWVDVAPWSYGR